MAETQVPSLDEWKELVSTTCENLKSIKHRGDLFGGVDSETAVRECLESGQQVCAFDIDRSFLDIWARDSMICWRH